MEHEGKYDLSISRSLLERLLKLKSNIDVVDVAGQQQYTASVINSDEISSLLLQCRRRLLLFARSLVFLSTSSSNIYCSRLLFFIDSWERDRKREYFEEERTSSSSFRIIKSTGTEREKLLGGATGGRRLRQRFREFPEWLHPRVANPSYIASKRRRMQWCWHSRLLIPIFSCSRETRDGNSRGDGCLPQTTISPIPAHDSLLGNVQSPGRPYCTRLNKNKNLQHLISLFFFGTIERVTGSKTFFWCALPKKQKKN